MGRSSCNPHDAVIADQRIGASEAMVRPVCRCKCKNLLFETYQWLLSPLYGHTIRWSVLGRQCGIREPLDPRN